MFYFSSDDKHEEKGYEIRVNQIPNSCFNNNNYGFQVKPSFVTSTPASYATKYPILINNTIFKCDQIITRELEVITSPNYPNNYPTITRCIYTILKAVPNICQIRVKILDLDLENTRECYSDYLLIESTGQRFCGQFLHSEDKSISNTFNYEIILKQIICFSHKLSEFYKRIAFNFQFGSTNDSKWVSSESRTNSQLLQSTDYPRKVGLSYSRTNTY